MPLSLLAFSPAHFHHLSQQGDRQQLELFYHTLTSKSERINDLCRTYAVAGKILVDGWLGRRDFRFPTEVVSPVMHWSPIHRACGGKVPAQSSQD